MQDVSGLLYRDGGGTLRFVTGWNHDLGPYYESTFSGTITTVYNSPYSVCFVNGYHYYLDGDVWTGQGPGQNETDMHVSGAGDPPPLTMAM